MKTVLCVMLSVFLFAGCSTLSSQELGTLRSLNAVGITVDKPVGAWDSPANPIAAGALNILPGVGNFYLASGNGGESAHYLYGGANLLFWPLSILWGVPEAIIDAVNINEKELVYFYTFTSQGKTALKNARLKMNNNGYVEWM